MHLNGRPKGVTSAIGRPVWKWAQVDGVVSKTG